jgi:hypothetical protein
MATAKQDARRALDGLPEEASLEDIQYHHYVLRRIERGHEDISAGRVVPRTRSSSGWPSGSTSSVD